MSNPWGIKLKKTGLIEKDLASTQKAISDIEAKQSEMARNLEADKEKNAIYSDRQASLAADATYGQQERFETGGKIRTRRVKRKTRRAKKHRRTRKYRKRH